MRDCVSDEMIIKVDKRIYITRNATFLQFFIQIFVKYLFGFIPFTSPRQRYQLDGEII